MQVIGFSAEEVGSVHRILAAILHLVSLAARVGTTHVLSPGGGGSCWRTLSHTTQPQLARSSLC